MPDSFAGDVACLSSFGAISPSSEALQPGKARRRVAMSRSQRVAGAQRRRRRIDDDCHGWARSEEGGGRAAEMLILISFLVLVELLGLLESAPHKLSIFFFTCCTDPAGVGGFTTIETLPEPQCLDRPPLHSTLEGDHFHPTPCEIARLLLFHINTRAWLTRRNRNRILVGT